MWYTERMSGIERGNRRFGIKAKKCLDEGVIVPTALYGAEAWGM